MFINRENQKIRILMLSSEWPSPEYPYSGIFIAQEVSNLKKVGIHVEVFHFRGARRPWNYALAWLRLRFHLRKNKYDIIHAQFGQSGLIAFPSPYPLVVTFRGSDLQGIVHPNGRYTLAGYVLRLVSRFVASQAAEIVVVSEKLLSQLPKRSINLIPSGVDIDLFKPMSQKEARRKLGLSEKKRFVLFAADPSNPVKRYDLACAVVELSRKKIPDLELLVTRQVSHCEMPLYMNACDVLLLTSCHEGSPNVVKEALACDLPIVSVDVGDVRQRIGDLVGCSVCSSDAPEDISHALIQIFDIHQRINGRQRVLDLRLEVSTQKLIEVYCKVLRSN